MYEELVESALLQMVCEELGEMSDKVTRFINYLANRLSVKYAEEVGMSVDELRQELMQEGFYAAVRCRDQYNPTVVTKNRGFNGYHATESTYLFSCVFNEMRKYLYRMTRTKSAEDNFRANYDSQPENPYDKIDADSDYEAAMRYIGKMPWMERGAIELTYGLGGREPVKPAHLGQHFGIGRQTGYDLLGRAKKRLGDYLNS